MKFRVPGALSSILCRRESALISHRFPLDVAREAFATAAARDKDAIKVVMEP
jgi:threonine dehydrogenase-like Zn-dependent dehydrogenase